MEEKLVRLKQGLAAFDLQVDEGVLRREVSYLEEMMRWNRRINLTAIRDLESGLEKHLIDSLVLSPWVRQGELLDVGSGAGLPGIPLALARPDVRVTSVETVGKKIRFQRHIRRTFELQNFSARHCRIEDLEAGPDYDQITARAFASIDWIIELVFPYLAEGGQILLLRGRTDETDQSVIQTALERFNLEIHRKYSYQLPFSNSKRQILQILKAG